MSDSRFEKIKQVLSRRQADLTVLIENVRKPHNLAAISRTCDAVGIAEIHAVSDMRELRLTQMSAAGIKKWIDLKKHRKTADAYQLFKKAGMQIIVAHLSEQTIDYQQIDYTKPTAIIAGSEYDGVSDYAIEHADHLISIPMLGMVQSLNVSVAMSIILYEALKQRRKKAMYETLQLSDEIFRNKLFEWSHPKITQFCKEHKQPYPEINDKGELTGKLNNLKIIK